MAGSGASMEGVKAVAGMVATQAAFAVGNLAFKLALNDGMDARILAAYRYLFAAAFLCPLLFFFERKNRPRTTRKELVLAFLTGLLGGSFFLNTYLASIHLISVTFISAMFNLLPAITFILAVVFRMEKLEIGALSGQAKVAGTLVGIGGAMVLAFYKGPSINLWPKHINLLHNAGGAHHHHNGSSSQVMGSLLAVVSCLSYAIWLVIQAEASRKYPYHYRNTTLLCLMAAIQCTVYALCTQRDLKSWRMGFDVRLLAVVYSIGVSREEKQGGIVFPFGGIVYMQRGGVVPSGLVLIVVNWCIEKKGPLFASVFSPLSLIIVALLGSLFLDEKLYLGIVLGSVLIVLGLYLVLWGKGREMAKVCEQHAQEVEPSMEVITVDPPPRCKEEENK